MQNLIAFIYFIFAAELEVEEGNLMKIQSPNHPKKYPPNAYQFWDIRAPHDFVLSLSFDSFNLKPDHAYLYLGDGVDTFSTDSARCFPWTKLNSQVLVANVTSASRHVKLIFTSDDANTQSGFSVMVHAISHHRNDTNMTGM